MRGLKIETDATVLGIGIGTGTGSRSLRHFVVHCNGHTER
jgi:hypothetical protein